MMAKITRLFTRQEWIWLILCALILGSASSLGSQFSVFYIPLIHEFGWSRASLSLVVSIFLVSKSLSGILMGALSDRYSLRRILLAGTLITASGFVLSSLTQSHWHLYLFYGIVAGIGFGAFSVPILAFIQRFFSHRRGLATALARMLPIIFLMAPFSEQLIVSYGWRIGIAFWGIFGLFLILPFAFFLRPIPSPEPDGPKGSGNSAPVQEPGIISEKSKGVGEILKHKDFWIFFSAQFCGIFCLTVLTVHMVGYARESGMPMDQLFPIFILGGLAGTIGSVGGGILADRLGGRQPFFISLISLTVPIPILLLSPTLPAFTVAVFFIWLGRGGIWTIYPVLTRELFGTNHIGFFLGVISFGFAIGSAAGASFSSYLFDLKGSYTLPFLLSFIIGIHALFFVWMLPDRKPSPASDLSLSSPTLPE